MSRVSLLRVGLVASGALMLAASLWASALGVDFLLRTGGGVVVLVGVVGNDRGAAALSLVVGGFVGYVAIAAFVALASLPLAVAVAASTSAVGLSVYWLIVGQTVKPES